MIINKSKYSAFCQCPKSVWLKEYKNEEFVFDKSVGDRASISNEICDLECKLFGKYVDATIMVDGKYDFDKSIANTKYLIQKGTKVITKAVFVYDDASCTVDILRKVKGGYSIYATKSSTGPNKRAYIVDISYQKYLLQKCGINVVATHVINVNTKYKYNGILNIKKLFKITNVDTLVNEEIEHVESNLSKLREILELKEEPDIGLNVGCHSPYTCGFWKYCSKFLPEQSIFDLYATSIQDKIKYYNKGIVSFEDIRNSNIKLGDMQNLQLEHSINDMQTYIDKDKVSKFLKGLWYPLYFLDFETVQLGVPKYRKSKPYYPTPFQYSLHYIEIEGGEVKHKEFLADPDKDPRKQIVKRLFEDIPENACVLAYNKFFERDRLKDLAKLFPKFGKKLNIIAANVKDLAEPFIEGYIYNKTMRNSTSIKNVLPALYPLDKELDYANLDGVHNGNDAMTIFMKMKRMEKDERDIVRAELLEYCKLDTFAMVKIYEYMVKATTYE